MHRKLRSATIALLIALGPTGLLMLPGSAAASRSRTTAEPVTVSSYEVSPVLVATAGAGGSPQVPALAPAPDGTDAEWMIVNGGRQDLISITPSGQQKMLDLSAFKADNGPPDVYASVDADGFDWVLDNDQGAPEDNLYAVGPSSSTSPGVNPVATFNGYGEDMTLGSDGALYITDNAGNVIRCQITAVPSATCSTTPLNEAFDGGAYAAAAGGGLVWFTDAAGELGSISSGGVVNGPYGDVSPGLGALSVDPGTIVTAANGTVYAAGGAESNPSGNNDILSFSPTAPGSLQVVASNLGNVVAMTIGPDRNIWFLDAGASGGAGAVGTLNVTTGAVTEYPLPTGVTIPGVGARIATGPAVPDKNGDGEVFFSATSTVPTGTDVTGNAVVGVVSGIPFPIVGGSVTLQPSVTVSKQRVATLTLDCTGETNAECSGRLRFSAQAKVEVTASDRAKGASARVRRLSLGAVSYVMRGGGALRVKLRLSGAAYKMLEEAAGHTWNARVAVAAKLGAVTGRALTMVGPTPPRPKPKSKSKSRHKRAK